MTEPTVNNKSELNVEQVGVSSPVLSPNHPVTVHGGGAKQIDVSVCLNENGRLP
jgi:hypothetical protein